MTTDTTTGTVRVEDRFATDPADLWSALTEPDRLARWVAEVEGELRPGGVFRATFTSSWQGPGRVEVCDPPRRLLLAMGPDPDDPDDTGTEVEAWLSADGDHTRLVVEERGLPVGALPAYQAGWQVHVDDLGDHLAGRPQQPWRPRWQALRDQA